MHATVPCLNIGFSNAKGFYFAWASDDNIYHEQALEEMVQYLDSMREIGLVYTDYTLLIKMVILEDVFIKNRVCHKRCVNCKIFI